MKVREAAGIRRRRQRLGLSQRELAFLCRPCSQTTIYLLETGRMASLTDTLALRIAKRLDVDVDVLFVDATPDEANTTASTGATAKATARA